MSYDLCSFIKSTVMLRVFRLVRWLRNPLIYPIFLSHQKIIIQNKNLCLTNNNKKIKAGDLMSDPKDFPSEIQKHFYSLPPYIQETIMQSGVQVQSVQQLDSLARDLAGAKEDKKEK